MVFLHDHNFLPMLFVKGSRQVSTHRVKGLAGISSSQQD